MPKENSILIFKTGDNKFAVETDNLIEIIEMIEIRPMPNAESFLKGVINYRGQVVPICDLNFLFEQVEQKITINTPIIMVKIADKPVGFIVDSVIGVQPLSKEKAIPLSEMNQDYVINALQYEDAVLLVIDLAKVIKKHEEELLDNNICDHFSDVKEADKPIMHQRALSLNKSMTKTKKEITKFICFKADDEFYGLNIDFVDTVLKMQKMHWIPGLPSFILGVFNKRGEIISITDFKAFLGLAKSELGKKSGLIVIKNLDMETALLVDEVIGVVDVEQSHIQPPPAILNKEQAEYIQGEINLKNNLLIIVNTEKLLNSKKLISFEAAS